MNKEINCGEDCKCAILEKENEYIASWVCLDVNGNLLITIADYLNEPDAPLTLNTKGYCPKCGRALGFDDEGNPTIGPKPIEPTPVKYNGVAKYPLFNTFEQ